MIVLPGSIGFGALTKSVVGADAGNVTILSGNTVIVDLAFVDLALNDIVIVTWGGRFVKGVTAGDTGLQLVNGGGSASFRFTNSSGVAEWMFVAEPANTQRKAYATMVGRCIAAGTYIARLQGTSAGSNTSVTAGELSMLAFVLRGSN